LRISFQLGNPTRLPMTLRSLSLWIDRRHHTSIAYGSLLMTPDDVIDVIIPKRVEGVSLANYRANQLMFEIGGVICFVDAFREKREQSFGVHCKCGTAISGEFNLIAFTPPNNEEG
jgi:hypothetical protein